MPKVKIKGRIGLAKIPTQVRGKTKTFLRNQQKKISKSSKKYDNRKSNIKNEENNKSFLEKIKSILVSFQGASEGESSVSFENFAKNILKNAGYNAENYNEVYQIPNVPFADIKVEDTAYSLKQYSARVPSSDNARYTKNIKKLEGEKSTTRPIIKLSNTKFGNYENIEKSLKNKEDLIKRLENRLSKVKSETEKQNIENTINFLKEHKEEDAHSLFVQNVLGYIKFEFDKNGNITKAERLIPEQERGMIINYIKFKPDEKDSSKISLGEILAYKIAMEKGDGSKGNVYEFITNEKTKKQVFKNEDDMTLVKFENEEYKDKLYMYINNGEIYTIASDKDVDINNKDILEELMAKKKNMDVFENTSFVIKSSGSGSSIAIADMYREKNIENILEQNLKYDIKDVISAAEEKLKEAYSEKEQDNLNPRLKFLAMMETLLDKSAIKEYSGKQSSEKQELDNAVSNIAKEFANIYNLDEKQLLRDLNLVGQLYKTLSDKLEEDSSKTIVSSVFSVFKENDEGINELFDELIKSEFKTLDKKTLELYADEELLKAYESAKNNKEKQKIKQQLKEQIIDNVKKNIENLDQIFDNANLKNLLRFEEVITYQKLTQLKDNALNEQDRAYIELIKNDRNTQQLPENLKEILSDKEFKYFQDLINKGLLTEKDFQSMIEQKYALAKAAAEQENLGALYEGFQRFNVDMLEKISGVKDIGTLNKAAILDGVINRENLVNALKSLKEKNIDPSILLEHILGNQFAKKIDDIIEGNIFKSDTINVQLKASKVDLTANFGLHGNAVMGTLNQINHELTALFGKEKAQMLIDSAYKNVERFIEMTEKLSEKISNMSKDDQDKIRKGKLQDKELAEYIRAYETLTNTISTLSLMPAIVKVGVLSSEDIDKKLDTVLSDKFIDISDDIFAQILKRSSKTDGIFLISHVGEKGRIESEGINLSQVQNISIKNNSADSLARLASHIEKGGKAMPQEQFKFKSTIQPLIKFIDQYMKQKNDPEVKTSLKDKNEQIKELFQFMLGTFSLKTYSDTIKKMKNTAKIKDINLSMQKKIADYIDQSIFEFGSVYIDLEKHRVDIKQRSKSTIAIAGNNQQGFKSKIIEVFLKKKDNLIEENNSISSNTFDFFNFLVINLLKKRKTTSENS